MPSPIHLPEIPDAERTPLVERLVVLIEALGEWGVDISVGQIDALLSGNNSAFCAEKDQLLVAEGTLLGGLIDKGFSLDLVIVSDGAGQFAILLHALCWVHAERLVHKLIPLNERHRQDQRRVRAEIWELYADLKAYQRDPEPTRAPVLAARFDALFTQRTCFETLNQTLKR